MLAERHRVEHATPPPSNETGPGRCFTYDELIARDKANLDVFCLRDESLEDSASLPDPAVLAAEIAEDLRAALEQFSSIAGELNGQEESGTDQ